MEGNYLITTDNWFIAPDGKQYKAVWGNVEILNSDEALGIKTNARSTNWFVKIGTKNNHVLIAGCQIHYSVKCNNEPELSDDISDWSVDSGQAKEYLRPSMIYCAN